MTGRPPILLSDASFYGTLAAVRAYGKAGIPVTVADRSPLGAALWSRAVTRRERSPAPVEGQPFVDWLLRFGAANERHVLYPTSDDATFMIALNRSELSTLYSLYMPDVDVILRVLDKKRLYESAAAVGIDVPRTWFPSSEADVLRAQREAAGPLIVKPRTQILFRTKSKGVIVPPGNDIVSRWHRFARENTYDDALLRVCPDVAQPMLQEFHGQAAERIHAFAAFTDESGDTFVSMDSRKILQRPRRLGIGLCFETAAPSQALAEKVALLCRKTGYYGCLQLELIEVGDKKLLIDFNPRFYNQMALDIARGLAMPMLVYEAARGRAETVRALAGQATRGHENGTAAFCNHFGAGILLGGQRLAGKASKEELSRWLHWYGAHRSGIIDPAIEGHDLLPWCVDVVSQVYWFARHPRSFLNTMVLDR